MSRLTLVVSMILTVGWPLSLLAGEQPMNEPWSVSSSDPIIPLMTVHPPPDVAAQFDLGSSLPGDFAYAWLRFYQKYLSSSGTTRCPMEPSCSRYSMRAIGKHGVIIGVVMTADRLIHEADEKRWAKKTGTGGDAKYQDPVENNDFWWFKR